MLITPEEVVMNRLFASAFALMMALGFLLVPNSAAPTAFASCGSIVRDTSRFSVDDGPSDPSQGLDIPGGRRRSGDCVEVMDPYGFPAGVAIVGNASKIIWMGEAIGANPSERVSSVMLHACTDGTGFAPGTLGGSEFQFDAVGDNWNQSQRQAFRDNYEAGHAASVGAPRHWVVIDGPKSHMRLVSQAEWYGHTCPGMS